MEKVRCSWRALVVATAVIFHFTSCSLFFLLNFLLQLLHLHFYVHFIWGALISNLPPPQLLACCPDVIHQQCSCSWICRYQQCTSRFPFEFLFTSGFLPPVPRASLLVASTFHSAFPGQPQNGDASSSNFLRAFPNLTKWACCTVYVHT